MSDSPWAGQVNDHPVRQHLPSPFWSRESLGTLTLFNLHYWQGLHQYKGQATGALITFLVMNNTPFCFSVWNDKATFRLLHNNATSSNTRV